MAESDVLLSYLGLLAAGISSISFNSITADSLARVEGSFSVDNSATYFTILTLSATIPSALSGSYPSVLSNSDGSVNGVTYSPTWESGSTDAIYQIVFY